MSTERCFYCEKCDREKSVGRLFDALKSVAEDNAPKCAECGSPQRLRLKFNFGLGADSHQCFVVKSYYETQEWKDQEKCKVEFYPFLVVLRILGGKDDGKLAAWLPYWHLHYVSNPPEVKYGQWAPFMDIEVYTRLQERARKDGYI